jgi:hypothetical protein
MRRFLILAAAAALFAVTAIPAQAITYGEPDDGEHPYVGFMLFHDPTGWFSCSGSALTEDVVLTAGHCMFNVTTDLVAVGSSGGTDVWVTFVEEVDLSTFPATADFATIELRDAARFAWLQDVGNGFIRGTANPHPDYDDFASFPATHDVGIVELDAPVAPGGFAKLADLGALDEHTTGQGHNKIIVETAGYGIQEIVPVFTSIDSRFKSTSKIVNLKSNLTDGYNLHSSNNPSASHGTGGSCFGDSGGPVMFDDTNVVVGVVSFGLNNNCKGADFAYRADIADTQDFVEDFLP